MKSGRLNRRSTAALVTSSLAWKKEGSRRNQMGQVFILEGGEKGTS